MLKRTECTRVRGRVRALHRRESSKKPPSFLCFLLLGQEWECSRSASALASGTRTQPPTSAQCLLPRHTHTCTHTRAHARTQTPALSHKHLLCCRACCGVGLLLVLQLCAPGAKAGVLRLQNLAPLLQGRACGRCIVSTEAQGIATNMPYEPIQGMQ